VYYVRKKNSRVFSAILSCELRSKDSLKRSVLHFQAFIPTSVMLPAKRLNTLLEQSQEFQTDRCLRHSLKTGNGILPPALDPSFLCRDHKCGEDDFPSETIQILTDHDEEVNIFS
jgi:hypothetical protein